jgi:hypothetical protein
LPGSPVTDVRRHARPRRDESVPGDTHDAHRRSRPGSSVGTTRTRPDHNHRKPVVPLLVLGAAIGWPGSLGDPADVALPRLLEHEVATRSGYLAYLAYSVAFFPVAVSISTWRREGPATLALGIAVGAAAVSALARTIGITRWLSAAFPLADQWRETTSATSREALAIQFDTLNNFAGAVGEGILVSLSSSAITIWLLAVGIAMMRDRTAGRPVPHHGD